MQKNSKKSKIPHAPEKNIKSKLFEIQKYLTKHNSSSSVNKLKENDEFKKIKKVKSFTKKN